MCYERNGQCVLVLRRGKGVAEGDQWDPTGAKKEVKDAGAEGGPATLLRPCIAGFVGLELTKARCC